MIIWIASYPKSGNTWIRSFIYSLLFSKNLKPDLNKINIIDQYPTKKYLKSLVRNFNNLNEISQNWIKSQEIINTDKKIRFFKTHHILCEINKNKFTDLNNTLGVIYIVRDPRNVITSVKNHYSKDSYESAFEFITDEKHCIDVENKNHTNLDKKEILNTLISSWKTHYNSWKKFPKNFFLIKYEDLIKNPKENFLNLVNYIEDITKTRINKDNLNEIINFNNFQNLKKFEQREGFIEKSVDKFDKTKKFFFLGPENKWKKLLPINIKEEIDLQFHEELKELGYI